MSKMQPIRRISPEDVPGAPSWFTDTFMPVQNDFNEQTFNTINGGISVENTVDEFSTVDLDHGIQARVKNPFGKTVPTGIEPVRCVGVQLGSNGQPTRALYDLAMPRIDWKPAGTPDGQLLVTATYPYPTSGVGAVGEAYRAFTPQATPVSLATSVTAAVCSITIPPGDWDISAMASFYNSTPPTGLVYCLIALNTAILDPGGTVDADQRTGGPTTPTVNSSVDYSIPSFRLQNTAAQTWYLVAQSAFTGSLTVWGRISARRMVPAWPSNPRGRVTLKFLGG